jgi:hypothetical protein
LTTQKLEKILKTPQPVPLSPEVTDKIENILNAAEVPEQSKA